MASTDDCKALLSTNPQTATQNGQWKRLSKRNAPDGVERIFASADGTLFARLVEVQGALTLSAVGPTRDAVDQAAPTADKPGAGPVAPPHTVDTDPARMAAAQALVDEVMQGFYGSNDTVSAENIAACGVAFANQCIFGLFYCPGEEMLMSVIVPAQLWARDKCCMDQELPLHGILPGDDAESPNESGDWILYGFDTATDTANALLEKGFVWDPKFQKSILNDEDELDPDFEAGLKHLKALYSGKKAPGAKAKPGKPVGGTAPAEFTVISTQAELDTLTKRAIANVERDEKRSLLGKVAADYQMSLVRMPPATDPLYATLASGIASQYRQMQVYGTTVIGVAHGSEAAEGVDAQVGHGPVGSVAHFIGKRFDVAATDHGKLRPAQGMEQQRMVDVPELIRQILPPVSGKRMGP